MRATKELNTNKGITLIALVITIIVMLILVAVTISMAVNGGLFEKAGEAVGKTNNAMKAEGQLGNGGVTVNGVYYSSVDEYLVATGVKKIKGTYDEAAKDAEGFLTENATYVSNGYTAVIPAGFKVSEVEGEDEIKKGLVIKDANNNEFVWIPVTRDLGNSYSYAEGYTEPAEVEDDAGKGYNFTTEYETMVAGVNAKNGFYIGRYETKGTISNGTYENIGVTSSGTALETSNWYDLYESQKTANIEGNGTNIQTAMVYGVLWDETLAFITQFDNNYDVNSQVPYGTNDVALNIWSLSREPAEWTQESGAGKDRILRGGHTQPGPNINHTASVRNYVTADYPGVYSPSGSNSNCGTHGSRIVMYFL